MQHVESTTHRLDLIKEKLTTNWANYFGSKDNMFALLGAQPTTNVVVGEALGVSLGGNRVPVHER